MKLGVKVIHCSERDTQITDQPKQVDEFVNTWSIEGFREEGTTTAEMGWGTHEKELPPLAYEHTDGPRNQICLARMGINTWVRSWVPDYCIHGMVVRHGEAFTISDKLTVWENGKAVYRPTVHYAYCPCDCAIASPERAARLRLPAAGEPADHERRDHQRRRHPGRAAHGPRLQLVVDRQRPAASRSRAGSCRTRTPRPCRWPSRVVAAAMWMIENPRDGRLRARRPAARLRPGASPSRTSASSSRRRRTGRR